MATTPLTTLLVALSVLAVCSSTLVESASHPLRRQTMTTDMQHQDPIAAPIPDLLIPVPTSQSSQGFWPSSTISRYPSINTDAYDNWFCRTAPPPNSYLTRGPGRTLIRIPQSNGDPRRWIPSPALTHALFEFDEFNSIASCGWPGMLALTMDDGPHPVNSHRIMDYLAGVGLHATFFWLGWSIEVHMDVVSRALCEGHHIGSHTWGHPDLTTLTLEQLDKEMNDTEAILSQALGGQWRPRYMRPPYGSVNLGVMKRLLELKYQVVTWNFDSNDWRPEITPGHIRFQYDLLRHRDPSRESFITLQHDVHAKTVHVAAHVYQQVKAAGFTMVPMYVCLNEPAYLGLGP